MSYGGIHSVELGAVRFLSLGEAAASLNVSRSTVGRMIRDGQLGAIKLRSRLVVPEVALPDQSGCAAAKRRDGEPPSKVRAFLEVRLVAGMLGVSRATLYRMIGDGEFPGTHVRRRVVVPGAVIAEMVDRAVSTQPIVEPKAWVSSPGH